jgi:hypothetical protein
MTKPGFEAPIIEEPLDNPNLSTSENRQLDKLMEIMPAQAARRVMRLTGLEEDAKETTSSPKAEKPKGSTKGSSSKRIDRPSRNSRIYDADESVASYYNSIDPLKN